MFRQKWKLNKQKWKDYIDFVNYNTTQLKLGFLIRLVTKIFLTKGMILLDNSDSFIFSSYFCSTLVLNVFNGIF